MTAGMVKRTVAKDAPKAMLTTVCIRLSSAARTAVMSSGAAEMTATPTAPMARGSP